MDYAQAAKRLKQAATHSGRGRGLTASGGFACGLKILQDAVPTVHVAGTNGKGSTCAMIASILKAAGYRTGLYTSPYLADWRDSFAIDGKMITKAEFARVATAVFEQADIMAADGTPSDGVRDFNRLRVLLVSGAGLRHRGDRGGHGRAAGRDQRDFPSACQRHHGHIVRPYGVSGRYAGERLHGKSAASSSPAAYHGVLSGAAGGGDVGDPRRRAQRRQ